MSINAINILPCKTAGCPTFDSCAIKKNMVKKWGSHKVGDIVLFDFNRNGTSDHIGLVIGINSDGSITTIEGNTGAGNNTNGGQVQKRERYKYQIKYFVRPKYNAEVTVSMVIATAKAELGYKESPKNSNKTKYGKWIGANGQPWCCSFICWLFAHVKGEVKPVNKPTGKYDGTIPKPTLQSGSNGSSVQLLQKFLNWYGGFGLKLDGDFGENTKNALERFQKTESIIVDGVYGNQSYKRALSYVNKTDDGKETYKGSLPKLPIKVSTTRGKELSAKAKSLAWPLGTSEKKYKYKGGSPTSACKKAMNKRGYKKKISLSDCGYFQNSIIYAVLGKKVKILGGVKSSFKSVKGFNIVHKGTIGSGVLKEGDIIRYKKKSGQHTLMYVGNGVIAEAGRGTRFGRMIKSKKYNDSKVKHSTIQVLRVVEGTKEKDYLAKGDKGNEVRKWQSFLKWYGYDCEADGEFGNVTLSFTKKFQKDNNLTSDGKVGLKTLNKAKEIRK